MYNFYQKILICTHKKPIDLKNVVVFFTRSAVFTSTEKVKDTNSKGEVVDKIEFCFSQKLSLCKKITSQTQIVKGEN